MYEDYIYLWKILRDYEELKISLKKINEITSLTDEDIEEIKRKAMELSKPNIDDSGEDLINMLSENNNDKYCDGCLFLSLTELQQQKYNSTCGHYCLCFKQEVLHINKNPELQRLEKCIKYNKKLAESELTTKEALEMLMLHRRL